MSSKYAIQLKKKDTEKLYFQAFNILTRWPEAAQRIFKTILRVLQLVDRPIQALQC